MNRRGFMKGMAGILAAGSAPWVVTKVGVLMPVRQIVTPGIPSGIISWPVSSPRPIMYGGEITHDMKDFAVDGRVLICVTPDGSVLRWKLHNVASIGEERAQEVVKNGYHFKLDPRWAFVDA